MFLIILFLICWVRLVMLACDIHHNLCDTFWGFCAYLLSTGLVGYCGLALIFGVLS